MPSRSPGRCGRLAPGMKGLFRRPPPSPRQETGAGGAACGWAHNAPLCWAPGVATAAPRQCSHPRDAAQPGGAGVSPCPSRSSAPWVGRGAGGWRGLGCPVCPQPLKFSAGAATICPPPIPGWQGAHQPPWMILGGGMLGALGCCGCGCCPIPMGAPRYPCPYPAAEQPQVYCTSGKLRQWLRFPVLTLLPQEAGTGCEGTGSQPTPRPQGLQQTHPLRYRLPGVPGQPGWAAFLPPHPQEAPHR